MARGKKRIGTGTLVLDCQGLSRFIADDRTITTEIKVAEKLGMTVLTSGLTFLEAHNPETSKARVNWVISALTVVDPSIDIVKDAMDLLRYANMHGHRCAIDAVVVATALRWSAPITLLTSDPGDMRQLCGGKTEVEIVSI